MVMLKEKRFQCADCGNPLSSDIKVCPCCGSTKRHVFFIACDTVQAFGVAVEQSENQLSKIESKLAGKMKREHTRKSRHKP
jgi:hypothetical protein